MAKILSIISDPNIMPVNMGIMIVANGTQEFLKACLTIACLCDNPFVLANNKNSELIVSISSPLRYLPSVAIGPSDSAIIGKASERRAAKLNSDTLGSYSVGKTGQINVNRYCNSDATTKDGTDINKIERLETVWS
jgi:hypothetical protein